MLESQGVVTIKNDYQDIINAIAKVTFLMIIAVKNINFHSIENQSAPQETTAQQGFIHSLEFFSFQHILH